MTNVTDIWLFVQTATGEHAGTKASLQLNIDFQNLANQPPPPISLIELTTASQQTASNTIAQPGASAQFYWSQGDDWPVGGIPTVNIFQFTLEIVGSNSDDAWRPASIWLIFKTDTGAYVVGPQSPVWEGSCFSTQTSDCGGEAKPVWPLPWSTAEPVVEFTAGAIDEGQLEPSESATYTFDVVNVTTTLFLSNVAIGVMYDQERFQQFGVTLDIPVGPLGIPEIIVTEPLSPGGRVPVTFTIQTSNATPSEYGFKLRLMSWQVDGASLNQSRFFIDDGQSFTVVPD